MRFDRYQGIIRGVGRPIAFVRASFIRSKILFLSLILFLGCATGSSDHLSAIQFSSRILSKITPVEDAQMEDYLTQLADKLSLNRAIVVASQGLAGAAALPDGAIVLSAKQFQECQNEAELVFVLLHEAAHISLRHTMSDEQARGYREEAEADRVAVQRLEQLRWNPYAAETLLERAAINNAGGSDLELLNRLSAVRQQLEMFPVGRYYVTSSDEFVAQKGRILNSKDP